MKRLKVEQSAQFESGNFHIMNRFDRASRADRTDSNSPVNGSKPNSKMAVSTIAGGSMT